MGEKGQAGSLQQTDGGLGDLTNQQQQQLQSQQDQNQKANQVLSNLEKKQDDTRQSIAGNLK